MPEVLNRDRRIFSGIKAADFGLSHALGGSQSQFPSHFEDCKCDFYVCRGLGKHTVSW